MADPVKIPAAPPRRLTGWDLALDRSPQFLMVLLLLFLPFVTQLQGRDPVFPKWALTQMMVYLVLGAWALRSFRQGRLVWVYSRALAALLLFLLWSLAGLAFSPYAGAGGEAFRDSLCVPLWYVLLTFNCVELWQAENLLIVLLAAGLGTSLWAVGQSLGWGGEWQPVVLDKFQGHPAAGLGGPGALAGYLLMVWPPALGLLIRAEKTLAKGFWAFVFLAGLAALFLTGSKAGWAGFAAGALVFSFFLLADRREKEKKAWGWVGVLLGLLVLSFFLTPMGAQIRALRGGMDESVRFGREVWRGAEGMIRDNPVAGTGFGTFAAAFPAHRPVALVLDEARRVYGVRHAGNWVLELASETGLVGLALMLAFWVLILGQWWKLYSARAIPRPLAAGVFAAFAAVAVDNLLDANGTLVSTQVPLLFLAAFPVALSQRFYRIEGYPIRLKEWNLSRSRVFLGPVLAALLALVFFQVWKSFRKESADVELKRASAAAQTGNWGGAVSLYGGVLRLDPGNVEALYGRSEAYGARLQPGDAQKALADLEAVGRLEPDYRLLHLKKYKVLETLGRKSGAEVEINRAVLLDPNLVLLLPGFQEARRLAGAGEYSKALIIYQRLVLDYPTCVPALVDEAKCLMLEGNVQPSLDAYGQVLRLDPENRNIPPRLRRLLPAAD